MGETGRPPSPKANRHVLGNIRNANEMAIARSGVMRAKRIIAENREEEPESRSSALTVLPDLWTLHRRLGSMVMRSHVIIKKLNETLD